MHNQMRGLVQCAGNPVDKTQFHISQGTSSIPIIPSPQDWKACNNTVMIKKQKEAST